MKHETTTTLTTTVETNGSTPLAESLRIRLKRAGEEHGLPRVIACTRIALATYWRAVAGGPMYASTAVAIEAGLDTLEREAP